MLTVSVKATYWNLKAVDAAFRVGFEDAGRMFKTALVKGLTSGPRSGRTYLFRGRRHTASAAGEMPASRTGKLAGSVGYKTSRMRVEFGETAFYGKYLEDGTPNMAARPHVRIIGEQKAAEGLKRVGDRVYGAIK